MNKINVIMKKEFKDIFRSKIFLIIFGILMILSIVSLFVSTMVFDSQVSQYEQSVQDLKAMGKQPTTQAPKLYPLSLLRGVVDYIEIIGAILGIILGFVSLSKEKNSKTLKLLLSKPITKQDIFLGKMLGNTLFLTILMTFISIFVIISFLIIGNITITGEMIIKLLIFIVSSVMYILFFFVLTFILSIKLKTQSHALIISFVIWLLIVLILPQIGDTMDPDNQVPGGFFQSMNLNKSQQTKVLASFSSYETIRGGIEQVSLTKHYERANFATFGIKKNYQGFSIYEILKDTYSNYIWLVLSLGLILLINYFVLIKDDKYITS